MFEKIVEKILSPILSEYVEDFNAQNMKIGLWSGEVIIKNVRLRKEIIKKLNLPFKLKYSRLGILKMIIPWKSLSSSKIQIQIDGLELLITQLPQNLWECKNHKIIQHRKQQIISYCDSIIQDFAKKTANAGKQQQEQGYFGGMITKVIDNVQVVIKNIHVRCEDELTKKYSFGITLEELKIFTINKQGQAEFVDRSKQQLKDEPLRKKLILSNFGIYWNQRSQFFNDPQPHSDMLSSIARVGQLGNMNYLILMSFQALLYQRQAGKQFIEPQIKVAIQFQQMKLKVSNQQLQQVVTTGQRLQKYTNQVRSQNRIKLTQQQMIQNRKQFLRIFPSFYEKTISQQNLTKLENIIQKMQVDLFKQGIKSYMQSKQKQKMVKQKINKNKGWFSRPKQLTEDEMKEIENFMKQNFGTQIKATKRPNQFLYIKVNFKLKILSIAIANTNLSLKQQQGINLNLQQIGIDFGLRQNGYQLNFLMDNIRVDMYNKKLQSNDYSSLVNIIQKLPQKNSSRVLKQYAKLKVVGNPLDKAGIDTQIVVETQELLVEFDPRIIKIAQDFANIKVNSANAQAAIQAYGQIKTKVATVASDAATSITSTEKKKSFISLNVILNSINIILYHDPSKINQDIWALNLGITQIFSDPQTLKKPEFAEHQAMQKYCLKTTNMSMAHFKNKEAFFQIKYKGVDATAYQKFISDLDVDVQIQLFKKPTEKIPKIKAKTALHNLQLNITKSNYSAVQKIGDCFSVPIKEEQGKQIQIQKQKENEKTAVMKESKKIGVIYEQTKEPKKFIAVLSGSYLYLYVDKKDLQYTTYYYIKNVKLTKIAEKEITKKPLALVIQNSVNKFMLGFDKEQQLYEWMNAIRSVSESASQFLLDQPALKQDEKQNQIQKQPEKVDPNTLNFQVFAILQKISINVITSNNQRSTILLSSLCTTAKIHEAKTIAKISLKQIKISDNFYKYKYQELVNFLYSTSIGGKQKLIDIDFEQLAQTHPQFKNVASKINVEIGGLVCNFKPETVQNIMLFFLPPKIQPSQPPANKLVQKKQSHHQQSTLQHDVKLRKQEKLREQIKLNKPQKFSIVLSLQIGEIVVGLVNRKSKTMFSKVGLNNFKLNFAQSSRGMNIAGQIFELWLADYSRYPNTILEQQSEYTNFEYIVSSYSKNRSMVKFDVKMLELPNENGKNLFVKSTLCDLRASYVQQPVLRLITYLTQQLLPSLSPSGDPSQPKVVPPNDTKPQNATMQIIIDLQNIQTVIEPRNDKKQYLQLLIKKVTVRNGSYRRPFIKEAKSEQQKVLVENYSINVEGISIISKQNEKESKLTNDMNISLSCDLIQNTAYYQKTYGARYSPGMRVICNLSPFLMRINHDDYNFMMKCLFWNISYDDNAEGYFFDGIVEQQKKLNQTNSKPPSQPMYINVQMDSIILCVTDNQLPISTLLLGKLSLDLNMNDNGMKMIFIMKNLYGTNITTENGGSIQKGMFNSFGFERKLDTNQLYDIQNLSKIYQINQLNKNISSSQKPTVYLELSLLKNGETIINMKIENLKIAIYLKNLLILSKLAVMENNIQPPKPTIKPIITKKQEAPSNTSGRTVINIEMNQFLGCLSDKTGSNYVVMEGQFLVKLRMEGSLPQQQAIQKAKAAFKQGKTVSAASHVVQIRDFSLYFCNINNLKNKRFILLPIRLMLGYNQMYNSQEDIVYLESDIDGQLQKIILQCSVRDMLMINKIIQDNLQEMSSQSGTQIQGDKQKQTSSNLNRQSVRTQISGLQKEVEDIDKQSITKTAKQIEKKIKNKMRANVIIQPMQVKIVNDCNNNFMPVLNFITQQTKVMLSSDPIKTHLGVFLTMKLDFFNPRSANWQPVIQTFQITCDYLSLMSEYGNKSRIILSSSQIQQLKQLKLNFSTQLVSSLLGTLQIAKSEKNKIEQVTNVNQLQVSPYIMENKTNQQILIQRSGSTAKLQPLFKGPIRLDDKAEQLKFIYNGKKFSASLQKYGQIYVPGLDDIHLQFKMDKLNRILCFMNNLTIKNATFTKIYCIRYNEKKEPLEEQLLLAPGDIIPVQRSWYVKFSFNMKSFTPAISTSELLKINTLVSQSQKFKLSIAQKRVIMGHSIIMVRAPFVILNCLPKDIQIQFLNNGKQVSSKQISAQGSHEGFANQDIYNLSFKLACEGFYWSQQFIVESQLFGKQCELYLSDRQRERDGTTVKYLFEKDEKRYQFRLNIFCPAFIVSQLGYDIQIYSNLQRDENNNAIQKYYKLGGQSEFWRVENNVENKRKIDKITIIGSESGSKIRVGGNNCLIDFSQPISTKTIGVSQSRIVVQKQIHGKTVTVFTVLGVEVQLKKMALKADIVSRQITLRSRWIFYNNSEYNFMIKEQGGDKFYYEIQKNEKKPFYFIVPQIKDKAKGLIFKLQNTNQSIPLLANGLGTMHFRLQMLNNPNDFLYFKLIIQQVQSYLYYEISQVNYENLPYQIVMKSDKLEAYVPLFQKQVKKNGPPLLFINERPNQSFNFQIWIRLIGGQQQKQITVDADDLKYKNKIQFYEEGLTQYFVPAVVYVIFNDSKKFIVIDELHKEKQEIPEYETQTINFKLEKISFSIIQNHTQIQKPFQSFYFYMSNLEFIMEQTNKRTRYQAKLQFLQIDQDEPYNIPNPVIITPSKYKQFTSTDPKDKPKSIFNALVEIDNSFVKNLFINQMIIDINDLVVKIGSPFIKLVLQIVKDYTSAAKSEEQYLIQRKTDTWKDLKSAEEGRKTFIKAIRIAPFTVEVSAQIRLNELDNDSVLIFGTVLNALGVVITNIEDAPIVFDGIALDDCVDSLQGINQKLMAHYKSSVLRQLYKIFGSLNIIGNPVSLFRNISTGFKDLKDKPSQGLVEGPLQFGKGLAEGTSSLIAHSVGGALNSVQKVTGTIASGLAALTFDKQFEEMREKQKMKKPKHVFEGIEKGGKAVFHGFKEGITGLFLKPIQNTKKQGALGFVKGAGQGLAGLIVKPVAGIIDFASKTTQGLKNTALYLEDKPNENRIRYPRVLYTQTGMVREYDAVDNKLYAIINKVKYEQKYGFDDPFFIQSFKTSGNEFVVLLNTGVTLINIEDEKIAWTVPLTSLKVERNSENSVIIKGPPKNQQFWEKSVAENLTLQTKQDADKLQKIVADLKANVGYY